MQEACSCRGSQKKVTKMTRRSSTRVPLLCAAGLIAGTLGANPVRRIVTLLQDMEKEITSEMESEKAMYAKYECYCKKNDGALSSQADEAMAEREKQSAIEEQKKGEKKRLGEELKQHKKDREAAQKTLKMTVEAEKERNAAFEADHKEYLDTIKAMESAIKALNKGMGKSFLQSEQALSLKKIMQNSRLLASTLHADEDDQRAVFAFLNKDYAPASGEIVGILKQMLDQMNEDLGGALDEDKKARETFLQMKTAKETEIAALSQMIEEKTELKGKVAVEIVMALKAKEEAIKQLGDAQAFLVKLKEMCSTKVDEYKVRVEDAQQEIAAIQEAIVVLNDDDSLDIFKKADPRALTQVSLLQRGSSVRSRVIELLERTAAGAKSEKAAKTLALMANTAKQMLRSKVDFSKVLVMIDDMIALLKEEGKSDLASRDQCTADLAENAADTKENKHALTAANEKDSEMTELIAAKAALIEENTAHIAESKKAVSEATAQRMKENADYVAAIDLNTSAVQLIDKAVNVLNKYYSPALYKKAEQRELSKEEKILQASGQDIGDTTVVKPIAGTSQTQAFLEKKTSSFLQLSASQVVDPTESAPEIFEGERKSKSQKSNSVVALLRMLQNDIKKDSAAAESDEKVAQNDYENLTMEAAKQQAEWGKSTADATSAKAGFEEELQKAETSGSVHELELEQLGESLSALHASCDLILSHFDEREVKRENEIDHLHKGKAILSGASFE
ncbi:unnamed protein product [Amoebophrya sp. A25]|nr:unnamed protein product [Amoebophrya sp. A25]|eukprot:GSA25T00017202001.1